MTKKIGPKLKNGKLSKKIFQKKCYSSLKKKIVWKLSTLPLNLVLAIVIQIFL